MLIDLLNSANYIMVNRDAINILGLHTAVYCAELLNIYKKAVIKNKLINDKYFKIDRKYITNQTSLSIEDQTKCDLNLSKVNIIKIDSTNPDIVLFDVETFASILSSEDVKLLDNVSEKVKKQPKGTSEAARKRLIQKLKDNIRCNTVEVMYALRDWIDAVMTNPLKYLSVQQVQLFKDKLDDYCDGNLQKALKIIELATIHQYIDCQWAINAYEKDIKIKESIKSYNNTKTSVNQVRITEQKKTTNLSEETF